MPPVPRSAERPSLSPLRQALLTTGVALGLTASAAQAAPAPQRDGAPLAQLNLSKRGLALDGYDSVAYFPEGGGVAKKGVEALAVTLRGVTYRFATEENRQTFLGDPERFEPDYGGWCAWAMAKNDKVEIDPKSFLVEDGRLLVFYDGLFNDTRKSWLKKGGEKLRPAADTNWDKLTGKKKRAKKNEPVKTGLGLDGNDPLSLEAEGGPKAGLASITTRIGGVEYRFLTRENRIEFVGNPERFLPSEGKDGAPTGAR